MTDSALDLALETVVNDRQVYDNVLSMIRDGRLRLEDFTVDKDTGKMRTKAVDDFWSTCGVTFGPLSTELALKARETRAYWNLLSRSSIAYDGDTPLHRKHQAKAVIESDLRCAQFQLLKIERAIQVMRLYLQLSESPEDKNAAQQSRIEHLFYLLPPSWQELCRDNGIHAILGRCENKLRRLHGEESDRQAVWDEILQNQELNSAPYDSELARGIVFFRLIGT